MLQKPVMFSRGVGDPNAEKRTSLEWAAVSASILQRNKTKTLEKNSDNLKQHSAQQQDSSPTAKSTAYVSHPTSLLPQSPPGVKKPFQMKCLHVKHQRNPRCGAQHHDHVHSTHVRVPDDKSISDALSTIRLAILHTQHKNRLCSVIRGLLAEVEGSSSTENKTENKPENKPEHFFSSSSPTPDHGHEVATPRPLLGNLNHRGRERRASCDIAGVNGAGDATGSVSAGNVASLNCRPSEIEIQMEKTGHGKCSSSPSSDLSDPFFRFSGPDLFSDVRWSMVGHFDDEMCRTYECIDGMSGTNPCCCMTAEIVHFESDASSTSSTDTCENHKAAEMEYEAYLHDCGRVRSHPIPIPKRA